MASLRVATFNKSFDLDKRGWIAEEVHFEDHCPVVIEIEVG